MDYLDNKIRVKSNGGYLKQQNKLTYYHKTTVNIYIGYELGGSSSFIDDPTLKNSLLGAVNLTKSADIDKYRYFGNETGFDSKGSFSFLGEVFGPNIIFFEVDMSSSVHVDNK